MTGSVVVLPDRVDEALQLSLEHVRRSRLEPGCLAHGVHVDAENSMRLVFVEQWEDAASLRTHFEVPASGRFVTALSALAAAPPEIQVYDATRVRV